MSETHFEMMHRRLLERAGLVEIRAPFRGKSFEQIRAQECSDGFCEKMDNRMVMGFLRYGAIQARKPLFHDLKKCMERLKNYEETGNLEWLVDAANYCRCEFRRSAHPMKHFESDDRK